MSVISDVVVWMKYARYREDLGRRENWNELVGRCESMHTRNFPEFEEEIKEAFDFVRAKKILPSMRSLQFAGKAIQVNPARMYNCCYMPIKSTVCFAEAMFLLLSGTGVGYSVEEKEVDKLPLILKPSLNRRRYVVSDDIEGWASAVKFLLGCYTGKHNYTPVFDYSQIREKGALLVTSGGRAPGYKPLEKCLNNIEALLKQCDDAFLRPIDVHDIMCYIAEAVRSGGIRRAAMISLFSEDDIEMSNAKSSAFVLKNLLDERFDEPMPTLEYLRAGWENDHIKPEEDGTISFLDVYIEGRRYKKLTIDEYTYSNFLKSGKLPWYVYAPQRALANNSAVLYRESQYSMRSFANIWQATKDSGSGEPGVLWTNDVNMRTNPCAEISLQPFQFCNLVEIDATTISDQHDLELRCAMAAFIGTLQASYTDFHYLRQVWRNNTNAEALLGVSFTGIASGSLDGLDLTKAAKTAVLSNKHWAERLGINEAARITCVKPAGTTSLVLNTSSGIHAWYAKFFIRRIRVGKTGSDAVLYKYLKANLSDFVEDCLFDPLNVAVFSVPMKSPEGALTRSETALDTLNRVKRFFEEWIMPGHVHGNNAHNVSATISVQEHEWEGVFEWLTNNTQSYNAVSVLPYDGGTYKQAPFEEISEQIYNVLKRKFDSASFRIEDLAEATDLTEAQEHIACGGGNCEI